MRYCYHRGCDIFESYCIPVSMCIISVALLLLTFLPDWWTMESDNVFLQSVILKFRTEYIGMAMASIICLVLGVFSLAMVHHVHTYTAKKRKEHTYQ